MLAAISTTSETMSALLSFFLIKLDDDDCAWSSPLFVAIVGSS